MDEFAEVDRILYGRESDAENDDDDSASSEDENLSDDQHDRIFCIEAVTSTPIASTLTAIVSTSTAIARTLTAQSRVRQLQQVPRVRIHSLRGQHVNEMKIADQMYAAPCCTKKCNELIARDIATSWRASVMEFAKPEYEALIKGHMSATLHDDRFADYYGSTSIHAQQAQKRFTERRTHCTQGMYLWRDIPVCQKMYFFLFNLGGKTKYENIRRHLLKDGVSERVHKLSGKPPTVHRKLYLESDEQKVVDFINAYAAKHAMPLPGRLPNFKNFQIIKLPSCDTKSSVYKKYCELCTLCDVEPMGKRIFLKTWQKYCPNISSLKPSSNLCEICRNNNTRILRAQNAVDETKKEALAKVFEHLERAKIQRNHYRNTLAEAKESSNTILVISIDFAENVSYPLSSQAVGAAYFKSARKVALFGVNNEVAGFQYTFLVDEAHLIGKGPKRVSTAGLMHSPERRWSR
jgi:hypothetical protein